MSQKELTRLKVLEMLKSKQIKQKDAARFLGLSVRQIKRLKKGYQRMGEKALVSKKRGQPSNNRVAETIKKEALSLIMKHYPDFGPTLAHEKLTEVHQLNLSIETTRQWMIAAGIWKGKRRKKARVHQSRERRPCFGELMQMDGSPHAWLEDRGPECCLLVLIDDATSQLLGLRLEPVETAHGYFRLLRGYLKKYGRPLGLYTDKHGIFRVNIREAQNSSGETQFGRAMNNLGIQLICANSPQAKGRVERANGTLQDRLVKELRLQGISDIDSANRYLPKFIEDYNKRFSVKASSDVNAHRQELPSESALDLIFSFHYSRKISKNLELSFDNTIYQVKTKGSGYAMRGASIKVCVNDENEIKLLYKNKILEYTIHKRQKKPTTILSSKEVNNKIDEFKVDGRTRGYKVKKDHPWRSFEKFSPEKDQLKPSSELQA